MKYFLKRSLFLYFRKKEPRKSSLLFQKVTFRAPKCFLFFKKWKFSIPSLKTLVLFLGEPLRVFHYCFLRCFISPFLLLFSGVFIVDCIYSLQFLLCHDFFYQVLRFCAAIPRKLRAVFTLHSFPTFGATLAAPTTQLHQPASLAASSSALKITGPPTDVQNRDPAHLFVWITQYSAKGISW